MSTEDDEFRRIELTALLERARTLIAQYQEGLGFFQRQADSYIYELGHLDERLGGTSL